eukprot:evm.model.NODE_12231_length_13929_cov_59.199226.4
MRHTLFVSYVGIFYFDPHGPNGQPVASEKTGGVGRGEGRVRDGGGGGGGGIGDVGDGHTIVRRGGREGGGRRGVRRREDKDELLALEDVRGVERVARGMVRLGHLSQAQAPREASGRIGGVAAVELKVVKAFHL